MSRQAIIQQIVQELSTIGIPCVVGQGSDISIQVELLDASWGTGKKKIGYEASILVDESARTLSMWEKTTESGSGFSGGFSGESSFQSGTTLMRKVKSIQYGPDGKSYEYNLNLGAIPKTAKEAAKAFNWSFRTVLRREKAEYQPGAGAPRAMSASPASPSPEPLRFCTQCGTPFKTGAQFCSHCGKRKM